MGGVRAEFLLRHRRFAQLDQACTGLEGTLEQRQKLFLAKTGGV